MVKTIGSWRVQSETKKKKEVVSICVGLRNLKFVLQALGNRHYWTALGQLILEAVHNGNQKDRKLKVGHPVGKRFKEQDWRQGCR